MAHAYRAIGWNRQKRVYDLCLLAGIALYLTVFVGVTLASDPLAAPDTAVLRALGTCAFVLLHVVLVVGPLSRLDRRLLPLLYNRRHMGVATFLLSAAHGAFALVQYHALGTLNPLVSVFVSDGTFDGVTGLPFQPLGAVALVVLFLMAATSHDFWLANLGPAAWKRLHMLVYGAYALLVMHVALGFLQTERALPPAVLVALGFLGVIGLHLAAGWRERARDRDLAARDNRKVGAGQGGFVDVGAVDAIEDGRALVVTLAGERVAVFRHGGRLSAVSNVCRHQGGPLGEGRVLDGCITCPWHGYQYRPEDGCSPPPFTEKVATYRVRLSEGRVLVRTTPNPPGTPEAPAQIGEAR